MPGTVRLHRIIAAKPEKVYRALIEADAIAHWLPPKGFVCTVHEMNVEVGGTYRMSFRNFTTGQSHAFGVEYVEIEEGKRIRWTDRFEDPNLPGEMITTITLNEVAMGTELVAIQEGIPGMIPPDACTRGWQDSLLNLMDLTEPEIRM